MKKQPLRQISVVTSLEAEDAVVELLGRSDGVGFQIELYFQLFDVTRILAYTIAFIGVVQLIEWGLLQPLERRMTRWRQ